MRFLKDSKPLTALLLLLFLILSVGIALSSIGLLVAYFIYGDAAIGDLSSSSVGQMKYMQMFTQLAFFVAPALLFAFIMDKHFWRYLHLHIKPRMRLLLIAILLVLVAMPFNDALVYVNQQIHLPEALSGLEDWMRASEERANALMAKFLLMDTWGDYLLNLLMIALLAALGEELLMRAVLQPIFVRWTSSAHWGIWITAFIFSFIHLQFYGFFARMFLGAMLGYLYIHTSNLWVPIVAHFFNNAVAVSFVFFTGKDMEDMSATIEQQGSAMWYLTAFSLLLVLLCLWYLKRLSPEPSNERA